MDTESKYLTHRVIPNIGVTGIVLANVVLEEFNNVNTIKLVLVGNTTTNTGCEAGCWNLGSHLVFS